jgi:hypothetical protein
LGFCGQKPAKKAIYFNLTLTMVTGGNAGTCRVRESKVVLPVAVSEAGSAVSGIWIFYLAVKEFIFLAGLEVQKPSVK